MARARNEGKDKFIAEEFSTSSLSNFTANNNTRIQELTRLAEKNVDSAPLIVQLVTNFVDSTKRLSILYLVRSIINNKTNGGVYAKLFAESIPSSFRRVYKYGSKSDRLSMLEMRKNLAKVFPAETLYKLDVRVKKLDPTWPVIARPPKLATSEPSEPSKDHPNPVPEENVCQKALKRKVRSEEDEHEQPDGKKSRNDPSDDRREEVIKVNRVPKRPDNISQSSAAHQTDLLCAIRKPTRPKLYAGGRGKQQFSVPNSKPIVRSMPDAQDRKAKLDEVVARIKAKNAGVKAKSIVFM